jgi:hypothetical protein
LVCGVLDGGGRFLALLGAEDLLHLRFRSAAVAAAASRVSVLLCSEIQMNIFVIVFLKLTNADVMGFIYGNM